MLPYILLALIAAPVLCALVGFFSRRYPVIQAMTWITAVVVSLAAGALLVHGSGSYTLAIPHQDLWIEGIEIVLLLYFGYLAIRFNSIWAGIFALAQIGTLVFTKFAFEHAEATPTFWVDPLSILLVLVVSWIGSLIAIYAIPYMRDAQKQNRFFLFLLSFLGIMNGAVLSNDLTLLGLFWELTTLCCVYLIFHEETDKALRSATRALNLTLLGGVALTLSIPYAKLAFGTTSIQEMIAGRAGVGLAIVPIAFIIVACFTKSAQLPFQSWILGAMVAPTPVSAMLHSSTMVNLGVYTLLRFSPAIADSLLLKTTVMVVGGASFMITALLAITQDNAKRVLAYSTIGNLGLICFCAGIGNGVGLAAGMLLLVFHAISKATLFLSVGLNHDLAIDSMVGMIRKKPHLATIMLVGMFSMMLPPFGAFASKWLVLEGGRSYPLLLLLVITGSALTVIYYTRWMGALLQVESNEKVQHATENWHPLFVWPLRILAVAIVGLGLLVTPFSQRMILPAIYSIDEVARAGFTNMTVPSGLRLDGLFGGLPVEIIYAVMLLLIALYVYLKNHTTFVPSQAYMCGENFESNLVLSGFQMKTDWLEGRTTHVVNGLAIASLVVMIFGALFVR